MPHFAFEAIDKFGGMVRGTLDANNKIVALEQLITTGHTPVSIRLASHHAIAPSLARRFSGLNAFDYVGFLQEFSILLNAGMPAERALSILSGLTLNPKHSLRIRQILDRVRKGDALSQAFSVSVPEAPIYIAHLLAAGEASGKISEIADRVSKGLIKMRSLRTRIISDLSYPALLIVAIVIVLWVVFHTVLPRLGPLLSQTGAAMPLTTALLLNLKTFFDAYGWILFSLIIATTTIIARLLQIPRFRLVIDRQLLLSPVSFELPRFFESALFCRNLQTVLDGGLPLVSALAVVKSGTNNRWLQNELAAVQNAVRDGTRLSKAVTRLAPSLPEVTAEFAAVGEETGRLASMMREAADLLEHQAQTRLDRLIALVSPVATLILGAIVAILMAGIVGGVLAVDDIARH